MNRHLLRDVLGDDFDIIEAEDGGKGLQILKECGQGIALVLLDIIMPLIISAVRLTAKWYTREPLIRSSFMRNRDV